MMTAHDARIIEFIEDAITDAHVGHGPLTKDVVRAALILAEECGEVADAALALTRPSCSPVLVQVRRQELMDELAQVAATSILMMANLIEEELGAAKQG